MALPQLVHKQGRVLEDGDHCTEDEYFAFCDQSEERWEFIPDRSLTGLALRIGTIRAMAGGTEEHGIIATNLATALNIALRGVGNRNCRVSGSDRKIHVTDGRSTFPDVSIICGPPIFLGTRRDTVTNPILVAEVLSPSTESYDRGEKLRAFQTIPALELILLIEAETASVTLVTRSGEGWQEQTVEGRSSRLALAPLGIEISLDDVYYLVEFSEGDS